MNIYAGNLAYGTGDDDLKTLFEGHGNVHSACVIVDRVTDQSKGFGFVEMNDNTEAEAAIAALDGNDFMGRSVRVNESRPREDRPRGGGGGGGGGGRNQW